ncbi:hypothetical protein M422DRAFT_242225 [Sphaerobolus stellatus SS14]|nr:hypothetical protein M422DRAFT_242225 [Sphaerobolus stellatus SS14]
MSKSSEASDLYIKPELWQSSIPTSLWLNLLREGHHRVSICAALSLLSDIISRFNRESPFNQIWTFLGFFKSTIFLHVEDQQRIYNLLTRIGSRAPDFAKTITKQNYANVEDDEDEDDSDSESDIEHGYISRGKEIKDCFKEQEKYINYPKALRDVFIALAMLKWPEDLDGSEPTIPFVKLILFGMQDELPYYRVSALYTAWAYRQKLRRISTLGLANQLLEVLLNGIGNAVETVTSLDEKEDLEGTVVLTHLETTITYYLGLIQIVFSSQSTKCSLLEPIAMKSLSKIATYIKRSPMEFNLKLIVELLDVFAFLNEACREESEDASTTLALKKPHNSLG